MYVPRGRLEMILCVLFFFSVSSVAKKTVAKKFNPVDDIAYVLSGQNLGRYVYTIASW